METQRNDLFISKSNTRSEIIAAGCFDSVLVGLLIAFAAYTIFDLNMITIFFSLLFNNCLTASDRAELEAKLAKMDTTVCEHI